MRFIEGAFLLSFFMAFFPFCGGFPSRHLRLSFSYSRLWRRLIRL
jgi:hypothetical protein